MINEHDIEAFMNEAFDSMPSGEKVLHTEELPDGGVEMKLSPFLQAYTKKVAELLSQRCDNAWYYDAANLIRQTAGIPVSVTSDVQLSMKLHPEDDPE